MAISNITDKVRKFLKISNSCVDLASCKEKKVWSSKTFEVFLCAFFSALVADVDALNQLTNKALFFCLYRRTALTIPISSLNIDISNC